MTAVFPRSFNISEKKFVGIRQSTFMLILKMRKVTIRPTDSVSNVTDIYHSLYIQQHRTTIAELRTPKPDSQFS
jgi:hypothetical protein